MELLRGGTLLEEVSPWGWALRLCSQTPLSAYSSLPECGCHVNSQPSALATVPSTPVSISSPSRWTTSFWTCETIVNPSSFQVLSSGHLIITAKKVTNTRRMSRMSQWFLSVCLCLSVSLSCVCVRACCMCVCVRVHAQAQRSMSGVFFNSSSLYFLRQGLHSV